MTKTPSARLRLGLEREHAYVQTPRTTHHDVPRPVPCDAESDLSTMTVTIYRESTANDRTMFTSLMKDWAALSPKHRALVYQIAEALHSATAWRTSIARDGYPR